MNETPRKLSTERLFEAAEAVFRALAEMSKLHDGPLPHLPDLVGTPAAPKSLEGFKKAEVHEATMFLVRLGFISFSQTP